VKVWYKVNDHSCNPAPACYVFLDLVTCCNKITLTRRLINNRNWLLMVLEAGKSEIKALTNSVSAEDPFPVSRTVPSHCVLSQ
jgi:hypothetical protein